MKRTPKQDVAACRAFALQLRNYGVSRVLDDAADQIESLVVKLAIAQVGRNAKRQDPQGLGPKDEHAVGVADAPNLPPNPSTQSTGDGE